MSTTLAPKADACAKAARGRPVPPAIKIVESCIEQLAKSENRALRLERTIDFLEHLRRVSGELESDLVKMVREILATDVPELREVAGLAESLYIKRGAL